MSGNRFASFQVSEIKLTSDSLDKMWREHKFSSQVSLDSRSCSPEWSSCLHSTNARITCVLHHPSGWGWNPQLCACSANILSYLPIPHYLYNVIIGQKDGMLFHTVSKQACWTCLSSPPWRDTQLSYHHGEAAQTRIAFPDPRLPWNPRSPPMLHQLHANTYAVLWKQPWKSFTGCVGTMRWHLAGLVLSVTWETRTV